MENLKHTPGPWAFDGMTFIRSNKTAGNAFSKIASVEDSHRGPQEALANAKLIAAAPELLEACEKALIHLEERGIESGLQETLRIVIKKATE